MTGNVVTFAFPIFYNIRINRYIKSIQTESEVFKNLMTRIQGKGYFKLLTYYLRKYSRFICCCQRRIENNDE